jgi:hypothetical protein
VKRSGREKILAYIEELNSEFTEYKKRWGKNSVVLQFGFTQRTQSTQRF